MWLIIMTDDSKETRAKAAPGDKRLGNKFWQARSKQGPDMIFSSPDVLWDAACEYFDWVEAHPLKEHKQYHHQGAITNVAMARMRAMTIAGLTIFLGITQQTWFNYRNSETHKVFWPVVRKIEDIIWIQKFEGAAAELFSANIISRQLGLKEGHEISGLDKTGLVPTIDASKLSTSALQELMEAKNETEQC